MNSILTDLYHGRILPYERSPVRSTETRLANQKIEDTKRYLSQQLPPDDCRRLMELEDLYTQSGEEEQVDAFACGFKLGAALMAAVFAE